MKQVIDFFSKLTDTSDFPPRWHCGKWTDFHGWLYIISDLMIWSAYFAIPVIILKYISKRKEIRFHRVYFLFAAFILACGLTHFLDALMFWFPAYRINALARFITAVASWLTVYHLFKILPTAFALKLPVHLEKEIEQRRIAEEELTIRNRQLNEAQDIAKLGNWEWDLQSGVLYWSNGLYKIFEIDNSQPINYNMFIERVYAPDRAYVENVIQSAREEKKFPEYYHRLLSTNGAIKTIHAKGEVLLNTKGEVIKMMGTGQDVSEQKKSEHELITKTRELEEVNTELQKFAYVASHDLQEPLRKIITYTTLLENEFSEGMSDRGNTFIHKISSSGRRMQKLINDLLNLSKFSTGELYFETVDLNKIMENVVSDLEVTINKTGSQIEVGQLPVIEANAMQMNQLFQNLVSNGIKFRRQDTPPVIQVKTISITGDALPAEYLGMFKNKFPLIGTANLLAKEMFCIITIKDNGIGFNEQYNEKIFEVFQRLHNRNEYEGTGIGLAICKKIVENHDGAIMVKSQEGMGAEFSIILPVFQTNFKLARRNSIHQATEPHR